MSQTFNFLNSTYSNQQITTIIDRAINNKYELCFIDPHTNQNHKLTKGELAQIRSSGPDNQATLRVEQPQLEYIGSSSRIAKFGREEKVGYINIGADDQNFELIKTDIPSDSISDVFQIDIHPMPYLDENHPNFSPELYAGIIAWQKIFEDENKASSNIGVETKVEKALKDGFEFDGKEVIKRISKVITPARIKTQRGSKPTIQLKKNNGSPIKV